MNRLPKLLRFVCKTRREVKQREQEFNERKRGDTEVGLGPGVLHAEGHAGTDAAYPVLKRPANTS
jgi:hypothetical protein